MLQRRKSIWIHHKVFINKSLFIFFTARRCGAAGRPGLLRIGTRLPRPGRAAALRWGGGSEGARGQLRLPGQVRAVLASPVHSRPHDTAVRGAEHSVATTFPPSFCLTQPLTCKTPPCSPRRGTEPQCPGHLAGTTGTGGGEGRTPCDLLAASLSRPCGFFFSPRAKSIPQPTSTRGWGLWVGWTVPTRGSGGRVSREGLPPLIYCRDAQPRSGPARERVGGLVQPLVLATHPGPR